MDSERYHQNRERVYDIYNIPVRERGHKYTMHHIVYRSDIGKLVPRSFDVDAESNLYPLKKDIHDELHRRVDLPEDRKCPDLIRRRKHYYR